MLNPLKDRSRIHPVYGFIISGILWLLGFKNSSFITGILSVVWFLTFRIIRVQKRKNKNKREIEFQKYIKRTGKDFLDFFDKPFKDGIAMYCFASMESPSFYNVIQETDENNNKLYIGELEWVAHMELAMKNCAESTYATRATTDTDGESIGNKDFATMCVLYDNGFRLPNFDLTNENLAKKTAEVLKLNKTQDIDFDDDKNFSDAWWLSSNENMNVRDLFTKPIRSSFMKYVSKKYRICGQGNMIIIITDKVLLPDEYSKVIYDMKAIQRSLKNNTKFYTAPRNSY